MRPQAAAWSGGGETYLFKVPQFMAYLVRQQVSLTQNVVVRDRLRRLLHCKCSLETDVLYNHGTYGPVPYEIILCAGCGSWVLEGVKEPRPSWRSRIAARFRDW